jgi:very-short-patch-repair endonuclease
MYNCEFCNRELKSKGGFINHTNQCLENPNKIKRTFKLDQNKISICKFCGKECKGSSGGHIPFCKENPNREKNINSLKNRKKRVVSEETKIKISKARIEYFKNNPNIHPYKNINKESYPEKCFRECLEKNNIKGWIQELRIFMYSIDFAFPEFKMAVEIDGRFHEFPDIKEKDEKRTKYLNSLGWRVIRFPAKLINKEVYQCVNMVLETLGEKQIEIPEELFEKQKIRELLKLKKLPKKFFKNRIQNFKNIIDTCNIDFSKKEWRNQLAELFNYSVGATIRWMKKNMKEFYEEKCYKRKYVFNK